MLLVLAAPFLAGAQEPDAEAFDKRSLEHRTTLHYDPMLDAPLEALVRLYRGADRVDELIGLYRSHIEQYPDDAGAKTALVRILRKVDRAGADELVASAVQLHPDFAPLHYLHFRFLEEKGDDRAIEALSRAIDLETNSSWRSKWLDELLRLSEGESARALAQGQLAKILAPENQSAEDLMDLARLMQRHLYWDLSITAIDRAKATGLGTEAAVEAEILKAMAEAKLGRNDVAGRRLDALLKKLAADHWRRREVMSLRISVMATTDERDAMLKSLRSDYEKNPGNETAILDYAELLVAAERRSEAMNLLVKSATDLPRSKVIEVRALELLEATSDYPAYRRFLEERLELDPERSDLRFRLVKVHYALGNDADAEQEFKAVIAGLEPKEVSTRILELQRFLRGIDRIEAAARYLEQYVRNHPNRFDVARELAEIYATNDDREGVERVVNGLDIDGAALEDVVDLAEFLLAGEFFTAAQRLLGERIAADAEPFELGLLHIEALGEIGDEATALREIGRVREMADTPLRYAKWLEAAVKAHESFESVDGFFDREQNRFTFDDDRWSQLKVEKFMALCEVGQKKLMTEKVATAVRDRLGKGDIELKMRIRLRKFLVNLLEDDPASATEVVEQLQILATEDPANVVEYNLRRALVYHRSSRVDLAEDLLAAVDPTEIDSADLLREAADVLLEYRFLEQAAKALAAVNQLEPRDFFSWEERLSVLVALGNESAFRSVVRTLRSGDAGIDLRESSRLALNKHLVASYWRSAARLLTPENRARREEILPLLASVEREDDSPATHAWAEWCRSLVLSEVNREKEAKAAADRFRELTSRQEMNSLAFPDGLALSVASAGKLLGESPSRSPADTADTGFLFNNPEFRWAFELPAGARIVRFAHADKHLLVLDDHDVVYAIDPSTGKLDWRDYFGGDSSRGGGPPLFSPLPDSGSASERRARVDKSQAKLARSFEVAGDRFFLLRNDELHAYSSTDGSKLWSASLPFRPELPRRRDSGAGAKPEVVFRADAEKVVAFKPLSEEIAGFESASGKLIWTRSLGPAPTERGLVSLNAGLAMSGNTVFAYGWSAAVIDAATGEPIWNFAGGEPTEFPLVIREDRGEDSSVEEIPLDSDSTEWQRGAADAAEPSPLKLGDFLSEARDGEQPLHEFLQTRSSLVGPGVHWAGTRLRNAQPGMGVLSRSNLWLMTGDTVRRISTRVPVSSQELPASGIFLGQTQSHAWFLEDNALRHVDFHRERSSPVSMADLGAVSTLRGVLVGNLLVVRGEKGIKAVNALTGRVVGQTPWPAKLSEFLKSRFAEAGVEAAAETWQGRIVRRGPGQPGYCVPVSDAVANGRYVTAFGDGTLVCLADPEKKPASKPRAE